MSAGTFTPAPGAAPLSRMVLAQARMEARLMLRNGEQLLLAIVIPVIVLVGGVAGADRLGLDLEGHRPVDVLTPGVLALAVVLQTLIVNWSLVGGSRGAYVIRPATVYPFDSYIQYLFLIMLALVILALTTARAIERSRLGYGFATIRDDELAAEASGVPTLKLKLVATTLSGAFMGMAGAPFPYYIGFLEPSSAFGLSYAVKTVAALIGGFVAGRSRAAPVETVSLDKE